jgi:glycosyltransferase involved in cell wall biosynthesis
MRVLLVIPSVLKRGLEVDVAADRHPTMDYYALADAVRERGGKVEIVDYTHVSSSKLPRDVALAWLAYRRRNQFDVIFTNGENVSLPLALMFKATSKRPRHITIGHRLSASKKRPLFTVLKAHTRIDKIFVYAATQRDYAVNELKVPSSVIALIPFHADAKFYRPLLATPVNENQVSAAGLEWRDYVTLIAAAANMPEVSFRLAAASPWSKHRNETEKRDLPANVHARRYEYGELRDLYASSAIVAVPLYENDFQAGVTSILEAMAMGKPVIVTQTTGQRDVIVDGENGIYVPVGDPGKFQEAVARLRSDADLRARLGKNARAWIERYATLERWAATIADAIVGKP